MLRGFLRALVVAASVFAALLWSDAGASEPGIAIDTINADRAALGLGPISVRLELSKAAEYRLADMVEHGYVRGESPSGRAMRDWLADAGYRPYGWWHPTRWNYTSGRHVAFSLLSNETLRPILLDPKAQDIGIAFYDAPFRLNTGKPVEGLWQFVVPKLPPDPVSNPIADLALAINRTRTENGLEPMTLNSDLSDAAAAHARDLVMRNYRGHTSPEGEEPLDRVLKTDYRVLSVGEILAYGQNSADRAVQWWLNSPGHARILRSDKYVDVGLAYEYGPLNLGSRVYYHVWAAVLGKAAPLPTQ